MLRSKTCKAISKFNDGCHLQKERKIATETFFVEVGPEAVWLLRLKTYKKSEMQQLLIK